MTTQGKTYQRSQPRLGPLLVIRGGLFMSFLFLIVFSRIANGVALAEGTEISPPTASAPTQSLTPPSLNTSSKAVTGSDSCEVSSSFPDEVRRWCALITGHALRNDLPPDLIAALIWQESGGDPNAYSHSGAVGLMQVMPRDGIAATFVCQNGPCFASRPTISELEQPEFNIEFGTRMLAGLFARYGSLRQALRAYGPMDVGFSYADTVLKLYENYGRD